MESHRLTQTLLPLSSGAAEPAPPLRIRPLGLTSELSSDELLRTDPFSPMNPGSPQEEGLPRPHRVETDSVPRPATEHAPLMQAPGAGISPLSPNAVPLWNAQ